MLFCTYSRIKNNFVFLLLVALVLILKCVDLILDIYFDRFLVGFNRAFLDVVGEHGAGDSGH